MAGPITFSLDKHGKEHQQTQQMHGAGYMGKNHMRWVDPMMIVRQL